MMAVDPGFDRMGVAILVYEKKERVLYSECIVTKASDPREKRLGQIGTRLKEIIKKWKPGVLATETLFFNQNVTSAIGVAEARGVALYECALAKMPVHEYSPQTIKIAVTSYGKASKDQVLKMWTKLVSMPEGKRFDDEIDAIAIGLTHLAHHPKQSYPHTSLKKVANKKDIC